MVKIGDKIKLISMAKDPNTKQNDPSWNKTIHTGDFGTVVGIANAEAFNTTQIWVHFENGSRLALLEGIDTYEIITE